MCQLAEPEKLKLGWRQQDSETNGIIFQLFLGSRDFFPWQPAPSRKSATRGVKYPEVVAIANTGHFPEDGPAPEKRG
jgi:hypothetical protein